MKRRIWKIQNKQDFVLAVVISTATKFNLPLEVQHCIYRRSMLLAVILLIYAHTYTFKLVQGLCHTPILIECLTYLRI